MKVDFFQSKHATSPTGRPRDVGYYLDRIRDGAVKDLIFEARAEKDKAKYNLLKGKLTAVTFGGTFNHRSKDGLKEHSGLLTLDFDKMTYEQTIELKELLTQNEYVFAVWISPSGVGLKVLIKIPKVKDNETYLSYYQSLYDYFSWIDTKFGEGVIDKSGKDISRLCFESYDPEIYVNFNSKTWIERHVVEVIEHNDIHQVTVYPLQDQNAIANRLIEWFKKKFDRGARNNSLFILAAAFNDFGVDEYLASTYLRQYSQKDFTVSEINTLIKSAYKKTSQFGSKTFEDKTIKNRVEKLITTGKTVKDVLKEFPTLNEEELNKEVQLIKQTAQTGVFWSEEKDGIKISAFMFKSYLEQLNYYKYYPAGQAKTFIFITKTGNFVNSTFEPQIKDKVLSDMILRSEIDVYDHLAENTKYFQSSYLNMLETATIQTEKDTKDMANIYFKNHAIRVYKDRIEKVDYKHLEAFVWQDQIIDRDYLEADHHDSMFRSFIWFASGQDKERYNTMKSVIGFMLHGYKTSATNKAIIFNDETISDNPNGRSGKTLVALAIGKMKKYSMIDGKLFDFGKSFPYQTVPIDTQVLVFDDIKKNFPFEKLFSVITGGFTIEYKNQQPVTLSVSDSPKIIINTNYTVKTIGDSHLARVFEVEMSNYFSVRHTPQMEFGCMFFDEWDDLEWARFDRFMINCLQYYLTNGLVASTPKNLAVRKFINNTNSDFYEFVCEGRIKLNERIYKDDNYTAFVTEYDGTAKWLTKKTMTSWVKMYAETYGYEYQENSSNGRKWFMISDSQELSTPPQEISTPPQGLSTPPQEISFDILDDDLPF
jgi:hypothetical protein